MRGTIEFRLHVAAVLTRRVLTIAADRAKKI
jgi:CO/xanthine dehydrogenase FAD-binding subunit